jgi:hypothetical protein
MNIFFTYSLLLLIFVYSCSDHQNGKEVTSLTDEAVSDSPEKDGQIQQYNIDRMRKNSGVSLPCDTLSLMEYVLNQYPAGTYLVESDKASPNVVPKPAVLYLRQFPGYILGVIAKSRSGERLIETKNIVGYDQSFIDLDSSDLGTPFFYLTLFQCSNNSFEVIWESPIPSHGGFNKMNMKRWNQKRTDFVEVNFHYGQGTGHINYNYFFIDGLNSEPHLLMTYEGINFKRTISNVNDDNFPDYYEHVYYDLGDRIISKDSVAFIWKENDKVYVNTRNSKQTRQY